MKPGEIRRKTMQIIWQLGGRIPRNDTRLRGWYGEWMALRYLKKKGYRVIAQNWRSPIDNRREIDLIAMDQEMLVFLEVRARSENSLCNGYQSITQRKRKVLLSACRDFLRHDSFCRSSYRFDVIEMDLGDSNATIFHHEHVSLFP